MEFNLNLILILAFYLIFSFYKLDTNAIWGATVLNCIPGVKLTKYTYTLIHLNTVAPSNITIF